MRIRIEDQVPAAGTGNRLTPRQYQAAWLAAYAERTAQWMFPNPVYRTPVPAGDRWAQRHLPFYGRWLRFQMTYPGIASGVEPYRFDPDYPHLDGHAINESNAQRRQQFEAWIRSQIEGAAVMGMTLALNSAITFENGAVQQSNYHDYDVARCNPRGQRTAHGRRRDQQREHNAGTRYHELHRADADA